MYGVREQKVFSDGLEYTKRTEVIATDGGFVALEATTLAAQQQPRPIVAPPSPPAITAGPPPVLIKTAPEPEPCCDYGCCECDDHFKWYSFAGKGAGVILLLILLYLIGIVAFVAYIAAIAAMYIVMCVMALLCSGDDD
ncbi:uncharacterized protein LOC110232050 [Exaiptasia diaphana]|uniref:Uncharacterized protein n=1 Tax=Exaiptasia diaphana TaxID=2652724 RepID=A0A913WR18_EXADI|nr:uncharacterized protein LOC110232050 [Exaiptasia diaphana]